MWALQTTRYRRPTAKFHATFGTGTGTSLGAGISASLAWLRFIGVDERESLASVRRDGSVERAWMVG